MAERKSVRLIFSISTFFFFFFRETLLGLKEWRNKRVGQAQYESEISHFLIGGYRCHRIKSSFLSSYLFFTFSPLVQEFNESWLIQNRVRLTHCKSKALSSNVNFLYSQYSNSISKERDALLFQPTSTDSVSSSLVSSVVIISFDFNVVIFWKYKKSRVDYFSYFSKFLGEKLSSFPLFSYWVVWRWSYIRRFAEDYFLRKPIIALSIVPIIYWGLNWIEEKASWARLNVKKS